MLKNGQKITSELAHKLCGLFGFSKSSASRRASSSSISSASSVTVQAVTLLFVLCGREIFAEEPMDHEGFFPITYKIH